MVYHHLPQKAEKQIITNTNFPPQGDIDDGGIPPFVGDMLFEDGVTLMQFEQNTDDMEYE